MNTQLKIKGINEKVKLHLLISLPNFRLHISPVFTSLLVNFSHSITDVKLSNVLLLLNIQVF